MTEEKKRINAYLDVDLYIKLVNSGYGITEAVTKGLELLLEPLFEEINKESSSILEAKESIIKAMEARTVSLEDQLKVKDSQIEDRVRSLEEQLRVKDSQLEKQAIHIQTMLTQKTIEAPGAKKPWWRFW